MTSVAVAAPVGVGTLAAFRASCRAFVDEHVIGAAGAWDRAEQMPSDLLPELRRRGYLGAALSTDGAAADPHRLGVLYEEIGRGCSSVRSLVTVHAMASIAVQRWGSAAQRARWLPRLADGSALIAFALSEPGTGSDAEHIETTAARDGNGFVLHGCKKWITFGDWANVYLVFARLAGGPAAFLVERGNPGVRVESIRGLLGLRASMTAALRLDGCRVPADDLVGAEGFGVSHVAATALDHGRFSVAWGCVGIAQACLEATIAYAGERRQFGAPLNEHQLVQRILTTMMVDVHAARLMCERAADLVAARDCRAPLATSMAKYFAARTAASVAADAVQVHGANGCSTHYAVERHFRDAKIMEIIEGSTQIHETTIARHAAGRPPDLSL